MLVNESGVPLGRADVIVFRDRATGMILGRSVGFEQPSYAAFVEGLRHAMYPKDLSHNPAIKNGWPCFGRIENLYVDNAFHFIGNNITQAATELNFHVHPLQPASPWLKGAVERFFGSLNTGLVHLMPGTTLSNVVERKDHEHLGEASLTLAQFEAMLDYWICEIYHASPLKALGPIRGLGDRPLSMWEDKVKVYRTPQLPHPDVFISLAGDRDTRTIQRNGITWEYIIYESPELWSLLSHPKHNRPENGGSTTYKMARDPFDLGVISVHNPYTGQILRIPATGAHADYAHGLTLHQHAVIIANARKKRGDRVKFKDLLDAKAELVELALSISTNPGRKKIERALARFLEVGTTRRLTSQVQPGSLSTPPVRLLSFDAAPPRTEPSVPDHKGDVVAAPDSAAPLRSGPKSHPLLTDDDGDDDLEEFRAQKNWKSYHD